jgi:hypothetical protein
MDTIERARADMEYAKVGVLTPNEIRQRSLGMDPFPKDLGWGSEPVPMAGQKQALKLALIQNSQNLGQAFGPAIAMAISSAFGVNVGSKRPRAVSEDANPRATPEGGSTDADDDSEDGDQTTGNDGRPKKNRGHGGSSRPNDTGQNENDRENFEEARAKK